MIVSGIMIAKTNPPTTRLKIVIVRNLPVVKLSGDGMVKKMIGQSTMAITYNACQCWTWTSRHLPASSALMVWYQNTKLGNCEHGGDRDLRGKRMPLVRPGIPGQTDSYSDQVDRHHGDAMNDDA